MEEPPHRISAQHTQHIAPRALLLLTLSLIAACSAVPGSRTSFRGQRSSEVVEAYCLRWGHATLVDKHAAALRRDGNASVLLRGLSGDVVRVKLRLIARGADAAGIPVDGSAGQGGRGAVPLVELPRLRLLARARMRWPRRGWRAHDAVCGVEHVPTWLVAIRAQHRPHRQRAGAPRPPKDPSVLRAEAHLRVTQLRPKVARLGKELAVEAERRRRELDASPKCQRELSERQTRLAAAAPSAFMVRGRVTCHERGRVCVWGTAMPTTRFRLGHNGLLARPSAMVVIGPIRKDFLSSDIMFANGYFFHGTIRAPNVFGGTSLAYVYSRKLPSRVARVRRSLERAVAKTARRCDGLRRGLKRYFTLHEAHASAVEALKAAERER